MSLLISDAQGNISFEVRFKQLLGGILNYLSVNVKSLFEYLCVTWFFRTGLLSRRYIEMHRILDDRYSGYVYIIWNIYWSKINFIQLMPYNNDFVYMYIICQILNIYSVSLPIRHSVLLFISFLVFSRLKSNELV